MKYPRIESETNTESHITASLGPRLKFSNGVRQKPVYKRSAYEHKEEKSGRLIVEVKGKTYHKHHHLRLALLQKRIDRKKEDEKQPEKSR